MNLIQQLEAEAIEHFSQTKTIPEFRPGDTLRVGVKVVEGERTRIQNFEGVCIARANRGPRQLLHRPQDQLRRGRRARLPALFAERRIRSRSSAAAPSAAPSSIICAAAPASRPASPSAATPATSTRRRPKRPRLPRRKPPRAEQDKDVPRNCPDHPGEARGRSLRRPPFLLRSAGRRRFKIYLDGSQVKDISQLHLRRSLPCTDDSECGDCGPRRLRLSEGLVRHGHGPRRRLGPGLGRRLGFGLGRRLAAAAAGAGCSTPASCGSSC